MFKIIIKLVLVVGLLVSFVAIKANYARSLCSVQGYKCYKVKRGDSWGSLWSDPQTRRIVMRVNRMTSEIYPGLIIAIPDNLGSINHLDVAPFPRVTEPSMRNKIIVDIQKQAFAAYDRSGYLIHWGPVSGGKGYCPDIHSACNTPRGTFYIYNKGGEDCISTKFPVPTGGAPMPFCMFFYRGYALHSSDLPGYNASHGCVRLFYEDAEWLNKNFVQMGRFGTKVIVR